jgi:hypothetical protein
MARARDPFADAVVSFMARRRLRPGHLPDARPPHGGAAANNLDTVSLGNGVITPLDVPVICDGPAPTSLPSRTRSTAVHPGPS